MLKPNHAPAPGSGEYVRANYLISQGTVVNAWDKFSITGDHIFSEKNGISGYYGRDRVCENPVPTAPARCPASIPPTTT